MTGREEGHCTEPDSPQRNKSVEIFTPKPYFALYLFKKMNTTFIHSVKEMERFSSYLIKHIKNSSDIICILAARIIIICPKATSVTPAPSLLFILRVPGIDPAAMGVPGALQMGSDACQGSGPPAEVRTKLGKKTRNDGDKASTATTKEKIQSIHVQSHREKSRQTHESLKTKGHRVFFFFA